MMNDFLTEDTKAIILLCGVFGKDRFCIFHGFWVI